MLYQPRLRLNALLLLFSSIICVASPQYMQAADAAEVIEVMEDEQSKAVAKPAPVDVEPTANDDEPVNIISQEASMVVEVKSLMRIHAYDKAIKKLEAFLKVFPTSKEAKNLLLQARIRQNEQHLRDTLKEGAQLHDTMIDPEYIAAKTITDKRIAQRLTVAEYLVKEERHADALKLINEVLTAEPHNDAALIFKDRLVESMLRIERKLLERERVVQREKAINDIISRGTQEDPKTPIPRPFRIFPEDLSEAEREKLMQRLRVPLKSFNYESAQLSKVLTQLFAIAGLNYIIYDQAIGEETLTLSLRDETVESVLYTIQRMSNVRFNYHGGSVYVTSADNPILVTEVVRLRSGLSNVLRSAQLQNLSGGGNGGSGSGSGNNNANNSQAQQVSQLFGNNNQGGGGAGGNGDDNMSDVERFLEKVEELIDWPDGSTWFLDKKSSTIMIRSSPSTISEFKRLLKSIDYVTEQVLIEARFVEVSDTAMKDLGFNWTIIADNDPSGPDKVIVGGASSGSSINPLTDLSNPTNAFGFADTLANSSGFLAGIVGQGDDVVPNFSVQLSALEDKGEVNTLSEPKILTLSNALGVIDIRSDIAFISDIENRALPTTVNNNDGGTNVSGANFAGVPQFDTDYEGINLSVRPSVAPNGEVVTLEITPVVRELISFNTEEFLIPGAGDQGLRIQQPSFSTRQVSTIMHVKNGETVVIGGLIKETSEDSHSGIPGLGRAPIIGGLFRRTTKNNVRRRLLIFITATIIDPSGASYEKQIERITDTASVVLPAEVQEIKAAKDKAERDAQTEAIINGTDRSNASPNRPKKGRRR